MGSLQTEDAQPSTQETVLSPAQCAAGRHMTPAADAHAPADHEQALTLQPSACEAQFTHSSPRLICHVSLLPRPLSCFSLVCLPFSYFSHICFSSFSPVFSPLLSPAPVVGPDIANS